MAVSLDGVPVRSGSFGAVFEGTVEETGTRLCPDTESWLAVDWRASDDPSGDGEDSRAAGGIVVDLEPAGCSGGE